MSKCGSEIWSTGCHAFLQCQRRLGHEGDHQALDPRRAITIEGDCILPTSGLRTRFHWPDGAVRLEPVDLDAFK